MSPTLIADARRRGLLVVADQFIAPAREELTEALIQTERWPDWQQSLAPSGDLLAVDRLERLSWDQASHLTCPSEYVRDGLIRQGVAPDKITVIPYPIDEEAFPFIDRRGRTGPITIGFVGSVNLRKGIPYFFEVARRFDPAKVKFVMVGPIQANPAMIDAHKGPTEVVGRIPRTQMPDWIRRFDILFFPTTCEGFAYALMEAMATGLPVVTSPNSGTVARHGQEGFIAHYDQIDEFTGYITRLADDPDLRWRMGEAARRRYENFNLNWYATQLAELFTSLTSRPSLQKASA